MSLLFVLGVLFGLHGFHPNAAALDKPVVRSCPDSWNEAPHGKKKAPSSKKKSAPENSGACIEVSFSALDIQEYLQAYSRKENWGITDDQLREDTWTFLLNLGKDDLLRYTSTNSRPKGVEWTAGSAKVNINTLELPDGFVRTTVHSVFRGFGQNTDQFASQKEYWDLESANIFESSVVSALRTHFTELAGASSNPVAH